MSAITGIYHRDGNPVNKHIIEQMNNTVSHRGPNDSRVLCNKHIAFAHQMSHTTPESINEKLPDIYKKLMITCDARIDNRGELGKILGLNDNENVADSLFILKSYEKWGEKCPEKLLGDFAFAVWDSEKEQLFCARDHMGIKPFYYSLNESIFIFATEKKSILANPTISNDINEMEIGFFLKNFLDKSSTFYKNIHILPPAHSLTIKSHESFKIQYWKLDPDLDIKLDSDEEYFDKFLEIFTEAVHCRLRSTSTPGFDLSGGLDSSSIVCTAKKILKEKYNDLNNINTFSYAFDELTNCDERKYIQKIIEKGGINPHFAINDNISPFNLLDTALRCEDQPYKNPFMSMRMNLYKKVNDSALNVLLSGAGGDIIVSHGQRYLFELVLKGRWIRFVKEVKYLSKRKNTGFFRELGGNIIYSIFPELFTKLRCFIERKIVCETDIINSNFERDLNLEYKISEIESTLKKFKNSKLAKNYHYYLIHMSSNQNFLEEIDSVAAFYGIEPRYPYYDKRLVEFCYAIPMEMKYRFGWDRFILRNSMEGILPPEIQWRSSKANFRPFLIRNLVLFEENKLDSLISDKNIINRYVDIEIIKNIYSKYKNNIKIHFMDIYKLWLVTILLTWLKENKTYKAKQVDNNGPKKDL